MEGVQKNSKVPISQPWLEADLQRNQGPSWVSRINPDQGSSWVWVNPWCLGHGLYRYGYGTWNTRPVLYHTHTHGVTGFHGGTLECSISVEDELLLSQTSNPSVIYEYLLSPIPIPNGSAIHAQWPVPSAAIPQKLKCYILAMDQLFLLKTWNPHFLFTSYLCWLQPSFKMVQPFMLSGHPLLLLLKNLS